MEKRLTPQPGDPYFDEIIFPDGTEQEVERGSRGKFDLPWLLGYTGKFPACLSPPATNTP